MSWFKKKVPSSDVLGRSFDEMTDSDIESQVASSAEAKRTRQREIEAELDDPTLTAEGRDALAEELHKIEMYFWLLSGGDRRGEAPPPRR